MELKSVKKRKEKDVVYDGIDTETPLSAAFEQRRLKAYGSTRTELLPGSNAVKQPASQPVSQAPEGSCARSILQTIFPLGLRQNDFPKVQLGSRLVLEANFSQLQKRRNDGGRRQDRQAVSHAMFARIV